MFEIFVWRMSTVLFEPQATDDPRLLGSYEILSISVNYVTNSLNRDLKGMIYGCSTQSRLIYPNVITNSPFVCPMFTCIE